MSEVLKVIEDITARVFAYRAKDKGFAAVEVKREETRAKKDAGE